MMQIKKLKDYRDILKRGPKKPGEPDKIDLSNTSINKKETNKITGNRSVTINIHIDELIHEMNIKTTTFKESPAKMAELVTQTLLGAVNDSQIVAGQNS
jgi:hypothetical protein